MSHIVLQRVGATLRKSFFEGSKQACMQTVADMLSPHATNVKMNGPSAWRVTLNLPKEGISGIYIVSIENEDPEEAARKEARKEAQK